MKIYTSYFAKVDELKKNGICPVAICGGLPKGYTGLWYKKLAPKWSWFKIWKETRDNDYYIKCFNRDVLDKLTLDTVIYDLDVITNEAPVIALICYEKPGDFCHRHLVAHWIGEKLYGKNEALINHYIKEWKAPDEF